MIVDLLPEISYCLLPMTIMVITTEDDGCAGGGRIVIAVYLPANKGAERRLCGSRFHTLSWSCQNTSSTRRGWEKAQKWLKSKKERKKGR